MPVVSLYVKEGGWPCIEIVGGTWVSDACNVGVGGSCCHQDVVMAWPLQILAKREQGHAMTVFVCMSRGRANT